MGSHERASDDIELSSWPCPPGSRSGKVKVTGAVGLADAYGAKHWAHRVCSYGANGAMLDAQ